MADDNDNRVLDLYRALGRIDGELGRKSDRTELSALHIRSIELIAEAEQRSRDLMEANASAMKAEVRAIEANVRKNGEQSARALTEIHEIKRSMDGQNATLAVIRENIDGLVSKKVNWAEWVRWLLIMLALAGAVLTKDFRAIMTYLIR